MKAPSFRRRIKWSVILSLGPLSCCLQRTNAAIWYSGLPADTCFYLLAMWWLRYLLIPILATYQLHAQYSIYSWLQHIVYLCIYCLPTCHLLATSWLTGNYSLATSWLPGYYLQAIYWLPNGYLLKGAVSRDFLPFFYFMNWTHLGTW